MPAQIPRPSTIAAAPPGSSRSSGSFSDEHYAADIFPELHDMLVPPGISVRVDDRLVKIDNHTGEFFLFSIFSLGIEMLRKSHEPGLTAIHIEGALGRLPDAVVPPYRKKRSYISSLLAKNEHESGQPYNRKLFRRIRHGHYILNPLAQIRRGEQWLTVPDLLNLKLHERIVPSSAAWIIGLLQGMPWPRRASAAPMNVAAGRAVTQRAIAGPIQSTQARKGVRYRRLCRSSPTLKPIPPVPRHLQTGSTRRPASTPATENAESAGEEESLLRLARQ